MLRQAGKSGERYEIAFIDWQMPGLDGIETGKHILSLGDGAKPPHLVMVTAYGREEVLKQAEESGFENVLIKPVTSSILFDTAVAALGGDREGVDLVQAGPSFDIAHLRGSRILLVEDNEINQEVAMGQLEDADVFVDLAEDGQEAIRLIETNHYDVVLMDMQMPVMDGVAATRVLRSNRRFQDLPIIAMTANALASDRELCLDAGMNDHIAKPIDPHQLFGVLLRWVGRTGDDGTSETGDRVATAAIESDLDNLELKGIDVAAGLRFTGGNPERYKALLRKFAERQGGAVEVIRLALSDGDAATAERTAHSLKGSAATLGAASLAEAAAMTEAAIRTGKDVEATLGALSLTLDPAIKSIQKALPEGGSGNGGDRPRGDPATVVEPLARLKRLLESDDGEAADFIIDVKPQLDGVLTREEVKALADQVSQFEFDAALRSLSGIAARLSVDLGGE